MPKFFQALGGCHEDAVPVVSNMHLASHHTNKDTEEQTRHLFQRLSPLLMKGNAALILNTTPVHADAVVDGNQDLHPE